MVKPVINFMENYAPTPNRVYDLYQYYLGGGKSGVPNVNQPPPRQTGIFSGGQGGGGFSPYNPDMSQIRTDFRPEYDFRRFSEYGINPSTMDRKQMDMNQEFFYGKPPSQTQQFLSKAINFVPGIGTVKRGAEFLSGALQGIMPVNQRAILENQLRGSGVLTDNIGRIVAQPGQYNTPEGIMAGYNAAMMNEGTFDKRSGNIEGTLRDKYGFTDDDINNLNNGVITDSMKQKGFNKTMGKTTNLLSNYLNINKAKLNFLNKQKKTALITEFKKAQKAKEKQMKDKKERERLEKLGRDKDRGGFDPKGHTQTSIRASREDKSGRGQRGGFTNPGKGSYGPHKAKGGIVGLLK